MRKFISALLMFILLLSIVGCSNPQTPQEVVQSYHDRFYNCLIKLKYEDMSDILDVDSIQTYNKIITLKTMIVRCQCSIEMGYGHETRRLKYDFDYEDTVYHDDGTATVAVTITESPSNRDGIGAPYYIYKGKNIFTLIQDDGNWKITAHDAEHMREYLPSFDFFDKKLEFDEERIRQEFYEENS